MAVQTSLPLPLFIATTFLRFLQFVFAIAVLGLYGTEINSARKLEGVSIPSKWIYAEVVGTLSALTALVYCLPKINAKAHWASPWDWILFILWTAVFGVFAKIFIKWENPEGDGHIARMKNAVWIDLINMLLWFVTAVLGAILFFKYRGKKSLHTGRATV